MHNEYWTEWEPYYAWHPVKLIDGGYAWLRWVLRRSRINYGDLSLLGFNEIEYQYRDKERIGGEVYAM